MDSFLLRIFQAEVALQCRFVLLGAEQLERVEAEYNEAEERSSEIARDAFAKREAALAEGDWDERARQLKRVRAAWPDQRGYNARTWYALQNILTASANLSKLLWGSDDPRMTQAKREQRESERRVLRESLGVPDDSPLQSKKVRNMFEHFDEKLERLREPGKQRFIGRNIGGATPLPESAQMFGHYYDESGVVVFWDKSVSLREVVVDAARNLLPVAESESMSNWGGG